MTTKLALSPAPPPAPALPAGSGPGILALFRGFHGDLLAACAPASAPNATPAGSAADRLVAALHAMSADAASRGPAGHGAMVKAVFAMAMLADRALVQVRPTDAVVAARLFGANATVQTLFVQTDDLIRQGARADRDLATVYLAVLAFGFPEDAEAGARRPSLHRIVAGERTGTDRASPRAYEAPAGALPGLFPPTARRWWWALGAGVALFLLVSHLLWSGAVNDIQRDLQGARAAVEDMGQSWSY